MHPKMLLLMALAGAAGQAGAAPNLMGAEWAKAACAQWNRTPALMEGLAADWIRNDGGKGFKVIHLYRTECGEPSQVELRIAAHEGKAQCTYGGPVQHARMDSGVDYTMHATTQHWGEMGRGQYGPMRAMLFGALQFTGPKMEAMGVMGPFESFLLLVGQVPGETSACPAS